MTSEPLTKDSPSRERGRHGWETDKHCGKGRTTDLQSNVRRTSSTHRREHTSVIKKITGTQDEPEKGLAVHQRSRGCIGSKAFVRMYKINGGSIFYDQV